MIFVKLITPFLTLLADHYFVTLRENEIFPIPVFIYIFPGPV